MQELNQGKRGTATLLYIGLSLLVVVLSYVFVQATHLTDRTAQPQAPFRDPK